MRDEIHAQRPGLEPPRQLTDEDAAVIAANAATTANALNTIQQNCD